MRSAVLACAVTAPALAGVLADRPAWGFAAAFGAYLLVVSYSALPARAVPAKLAASALILGFAAGIGAACGLSLPLLLPACVAFALWQARTELVPTSLRVTVAMATLVFLLSTGPLPASVSAPGYGVAVAIGALWQAGFVGLLVPASTLGRRSLRDDLLVPWTNLRRAERFDGVVVTLAMVGSVLVSVLPVSHAGWLLTTALRVIKPTRSETLQRMHRRAVGTLLGAAAAGLLLSQALPTGVHLAVLAGVVLAMLLVGPKRYGLYSFCITWVALEFNILNAPGSAPVTGFRVLLTLGGLALGLAAMCALPRETAPPAGRGQGAPDEAP